MFPSFCLQTALLLATLLCSSVARSEDSHSPEITAQGFDITETQEGLLGAFGGVRVRFEVPGRIGELYVKERSYDVDLATTPEISHLPLFGLEAQVRQLTDVTLNFQNYINAKMEQAGLYTIELRVTDRKGKSASANLLLQVTAPPPPDEDQFSEEALEAAPFRFVRVGASGVSGAGLFGITWKTVEKDDVVIELTNRVNGAGRIIEMTSSEYDDIRTRGQLERAIASRDGTSALRLATAGGEAAGAVFGVVSQKERYLLKVTESDASLSEAGTTVTLAGEYKR